MLNILTFVLIFSVLAYAIIGYFSFCEYRRKFKYQNMSKQKLTYLVVGGISFVLSGMFLLVLGYLIFTM